MKLADFKTKIQAHKGLNLVDVTEEDGVDWLHVKYPETDEGFAITVPSVQNNEWEYLEQVLLGKKEPSSMIQITRVVGYYSRVSNWNASKHAELADRQKGTYAPPGGARKCQ